MSKPSVFLIFSERDFGLRAPAVVDELHRRGVMCDTLPNADDDAVVAVSQSRVQQAPLFALVLTQSVIQSPVLLSVFSVALRSSCKIAIVVQHLNDGKLSFVERPDSLLEDIRKEMATAQDFVVSGVTDSTQAFRARIGSDFVHYYSRGPKRDDMFQSFARIGGFKLESGNLNRLQMNNALEADMVLFCDTVGQDAAAIIDWEITARGVATYLSNMDSEKQGMTKFSARNRAIVFYLTQGIMQSPAVRGTFLALQKENDKRNENESKIKIIFITEDDQSSPGYFSQEAIDKLSETTDLPLEEVQTLRFGKVERQKQVLRLFIKSILARTKLAPIKVPPSFDQTLAPSIAFREYERGTRQWLQERFDKTFPLKWDRLNRSNNQVGTVQESEARCFGLVGEAGIGKSVFMANMARRGCEIFAESLGTTVESGAVQIGALHFFVHNDPSANSAETAFRSIARQLCGSVPGFRDTFPASGSDATESEIVDKRKLGVGPLLDSLILSRARQVANPPRNLVVVILDALDECDHAEDLMDAIVHKWLPNCPSWLGLAFSLDMHPNYGHFLSHFGNGTGSSNAEQCVLVELKREDPLNVQDLSYLIKSRTTLSPSTPSDETIVKAILDKCQGGFLWFTFAERLLVTMQGKSGGISLSAVQNLPSGMDDMYSYSFKQFQAQLGDEATYQRAVSTALLCPRAPIPESAWLRIMGHDDSSKLSLETYRKKLQTPAQAYLRLFDGDYVKPPHKSMVDWLERTKSSLNDEESMREFHEAVAAGLDKIFEDARRSTIGASGVTAGKNNTRATAVTPRNDGRQTLATAGSSKAKLLSSSPDPNVVYPWSRTEDLSLSIRFACAHACYHWNQANKHFKAREWIQSFPKFYRLLAESTISDGSVGLARVLADARECAENDPLVQLTIDVVGMSNHAILFDPREFAGQVLGRIRPKKKKSSGGATQAAPRRLSFGRRPSASKVQVAALYDSEGKDNSNDEEEDETGIIGYDAAANIDVGKPESLLRGGAKKWIDDYLSQPNTDVMVACPGEFSSGLATAGGAMKRIFEGHSLIVMALMLNKKADRLLTGSWDSSVRLWDCSTGEEIRRYLGHRAEVRSVVFSEDESLVLSGGRDKTCRLFNASTGQTIRVFKGHTAAVSAVAINRECTLVVTAADDGTCRVWDKESGEELKRLTGHSEEVYAVAFDGKRIFTGGHDRCPKLWELEGAKEKVTCKGHVEGVMSVQMFREGTAALTGSHDRTVRLWDLTKGKTIRVFSDHKEGVASVSISADSHKFLSGSRDRTAKLWDITRGKVLRDLPHDGFVNAVCLSRDGKKGVTACENVARFWDLEMEMEPPREEHDANVLSVDITFEGDRVITGSVDKTAVIWSLTTGKKLFVLRGHEGAIWAVAFEPKQNAKYCLTGSGDNLCKVWDCTNGDLLYSIDRGENWGPHREKVTCVAFSNEGNYFMTGSLDRTCRIYEIVPGKRKFTVNEKWILPDHKSGVYCLAFSGKYAITGSSDRKARLFEISEKDDEAHLIKTFEVEGIVAKVALNEKCTKVFVWVEVDVTGAIKSLNKDQPKCPTCGNEPQQAIVDDSRGTSYSHKRYVFDIQPRGVGPNELTFKAHAKVEQTDGVTMRSFQHIPQRREGRHVVAPNRESVGYTLDEPVMCLAADENHSTFSHLGRSFTCWKWKSGAEEDEVE